jgi:hypothetical protein
MSILAFDAATLASVQAQGDGDLTVAIYDELGSLA